MSQNDVKPWEKPWTTQEMIENAPNWSLAGDSGLLKYLEDFSERMLSKVKDTNDRLNDLVDNADATSLALQNATNQFMGLRNTQFIESRVYEDDETLPTKQTPEKQEKPKPTEAERLEEMKQAICNGLEIIDKYYEKVEIPESDSEDDMDGPNIMYQPIDPYINRPLPYVIGTAEWHKYWHVGLGHSSSDSEVEDEEDQFSTSEPDTGSGSDIQSLPERDRTEIPGISDSEPEDLPKNKMSKPVANSTFNDNTNRNMFDSSSDSETGSLPPQVNTVNSNFAEELAAKLGKVESAHVQVEVNTKPIKKQPTNISGGLFSDEPPPLEEDDIFAKKNSGLFSGGDNLFDDVEDDSQFWNVKPPTTTKTTSGKKSNDIFAEEDVAIFSEPTKKSSGLFDEDDDGLFSTPQPKKTIFAQMKTTAPLVSEEPPELEPKEEPKKKPIGGVSVLGPNAVLQQHFLKKRQPSSSESDDSEPKPEVRQVKPKVAPRKVDPKVAPQKETPKITSIFDDTSPLFSDDIFNTSSSKKFTSNLFDNDESNDLFKVDEKGDKPDSKTEESEAKPNIFVEEPPPITEPPPVQAPVPSKNPVLFEDDELFSKPKPSSLFSKSGSFIDDLGEELFSSKSTATTNKVDLFDPNPPDLDESDNKSESQSQFSLENEPVSYGSMNAGRASLFFDTEPPMLSNESSGIVRDQSNSRLEEDSSFYPYSTSSRRQSGIFHDQSDSLLTGKSKLSFGADKTNISRIPDTIPETDSMTKIDITPSGNESSLIRNIEVSSINNMGLFDDEDDLFAPNKIPEVKKQPSNNINQSVKSTKVAKKKHILFADSDSDDDLFAKSKVTKSPNILNNSSVKANKNIFEDDLFSRINSAETFSKKIENSSSDEFNNTKCDDLTTKDLEENKFNYEENLKSVQKTDPKKSLSFENSVEPEIQKSKDESDGQILSAGSSPGKLRHSLNINVAALLPGSLPPKRQNLEKSTSLDSSESIVPVEEKVNSTEKLSPPKPIEKSISFDEPVDSVEVLPNATKERAKIPVRRRPSSRRARQEAIRKSAIDLNFEDGILENDKIVNESPPDKIETQNILNIANNNVTKEEKLSNPLSPSTDEEDLLTMPSDKDISSENFEDSLFGKPPVISPVDLTFKKEKNTIPTDESEKKEQNIQKVEPLKTSKVLFEDPDDIFVSTKKEIKPKDSNMRMDESDQKEQNIQKVEPQKTSNNLFEDSDDIFTSNKTVVSVPKKIDSSIFSSSDSENDLFSTPKTELKKPDNNLIASPDEDLFKPVVSIPNASKFLSKEDSLFDDEDIFSSKKIPPKSAIIKRSLFDDDDDNDDDIFGGSSTAAAKPNTQLQNSSVKKTTISRMKKLSLDTMQDIDDPLEAMKK